MTVIRLMLNMITADELSALISELSRMHALMPIVDPTGYKRVMGNMDGHEGAIRALARCRAEIVRIVGPGYEIDA